MKHLLAIALLAISAATAKCQDNAALAKSLDVAVGGSFAKPKILPKLKKLALSQVVVNYKQVSSKSVTKTEKKVGLVGRSNGKSATGMVTAYLNVTDDDLTDADYQEITDHFYQYFQKALAAGGIDTVAWSKITSTDFYQSGKEPKENSDEEGEKLVTYSANAGNTMYGGKIPFAFGKMKKASNFCDDVDAPAAFVYATVDFTDILIDVDVKSYGGGSVWTPSYNSIPRTTKMKSDTRVAPFMKVAADGGNTLLWNEKTQSEMVVVTEDIPAQMDYADELSKDPSLLKKKSKLFSVSFSTKLESTPVVISTTREKYKAAAKKALEHYADAFVAKAKG